MKSKKYITSGLVLGVIAGNLPVLSFANNIGVNENFQKITQVEVQEAGPEVELAVSSAESSKDPVDIETARTLVNQLPEGIEKTQFQNRLDAISPNLILERLNSSANVDLYIKCENILLMSIDTNSITFEDFSGISDMDKPNAVNVSVNSSLPYQLNAYLPVEIQSPDKLNTMDKQILNIKENTESMYQVFLNTSDKLVLKDNCPAGNNAKHGIDIKLKGGIAHEKDVYKTTIKFEIQQK